MGEPEDVADRDVGEKEWEGESVAGGYEERK